MNFTKYNPTERKKKSKGSLVKTKGKKSVRYSKQYTVNLTKSMSLARSLLQINKKAGKRAGVVRKG